jgi:hypothetical protein
VLDVYDEGKDLVVSREVRAGELVLMVGGGHRLRMLEDGPFLEVKQDPCLECDQARHICTVSHCTVTIQGTTVLPEVHEDHDMRFFFLLELDFALSDERLLARQSGTTLAEL